jgi:putative membrane protein
MYNYMQPLVAVVVSVTLGLAVFTLTHALAVALIFSGVWLVAISRSRQKG